MNASARTSCFPPWQDDWITHVYGRQRTKQGPFRVRHMIGHQGTRYSVDQAHASRLNAEVRAGSQRIDAWLASSSAGAASSSSGAQPAAQYAVPLRGVTARRTRTLSKTMNATRTAVRRLMARKAAQPSASTPAPAA